MPFTAAHPLAILPLARWRWLDLTTLAIGAMAPDLMYFARGELRGNFGHSPLGIVVWCLPITLAVALLWHELVKWPLLLAAPRALASRLVAAAREPWPRDLVALPVSALLGAVTHVVWDGMTHGGGWLVRRVHLMHSWVDVPVIGPRAVHTLAQHASTLIGLAVLAIVVARWLARQSPQSLPDVPRATARWVLGACVALGVAALYARAAHRHAFSYGDLVVAPISGTLAGVLVASIALRHRARALQSG